MAEIQESLDVINYKLDTYKQKCEPITMEMVNAWKEHKHQINDESLRRCH
nr:hypothetical protein [uncultured Acetobacterium sp.]